MTRCSGPPCSRSSKNHQRTSDRRDHHPFDDDNWLGILFLFMKASGFITLSIIILVVIPYFLMLLKIGSSLSMIYYSAMELNILVVVVICLTRMAELRRALCKTFNFNCPKPAASVTDSYSTSHGRWSRFVSWRHS